MGPFSLSRFMVMERASAEDSGDLPGLLQEIRRGRINEKLAMGFISKKMNN